MPSVRPPKKTETIEVRLSHEAKTAFMTRCQAEGRTASEAVRVFIAGALIDERGAARRGRIRGWRALAAAVAGLAIGAAAVPSLAQTGGHRDAFDRLDRDHDGVLTAKEFSRR